MDFLACCPTTRLIFIDRTCVITPALIHCNHTFVGLPVLPVIFGQVQASVNLVTRQARVVTSAHGHVTPTDLTRAMEAAGFPARTLWDTIREGTRVVLDVQGLKVRRGGAQRPMFVLTQQ